jgi:serine/threonine protein phosphatase PrpC/ribosomal protein L40E
MLVCPQCQFENPNTNKFCQRCGTSLTHKTCHECGTQVPVNAESCHNCSAFTGTVWWAIISKDPNSLIPAKNAQSAPLEESEPVTSKSNQAEASQIEVPLTAEGESSQLETFPPTAPVLSLESSPLSEEDATDLDSPQASAAEPVEESSEEEVTQPLTSPLQSNFPETDIQGDLNMSNTAEVSLATPSAVYLDNQQRYRLLEPLSPEKIADGIETPYGISIRVLDCQPFQKSPLEALLEQPQGSSDKFDLALRQASATPTDAWKALGIPALAQPYLALKELYYQTLPTVHDAWQQEGKAVVLLEDRSEWQLLAQLWASEEIPTLQILYWLDEMAKLWEALEPWHCRQSLLEMTNLRVDEDQALGLVRLYPDPKDHPLLTLQNLGQMWQILFNQSQRTQFTSLGAVFRQMCSGEIETVNELRSQLEAIAHEQQALATQAIQQADWAGTLGTDAKHAVAAEDAAVGGYPRPFPEASSGNENDDLPTVILPMQLLSLDDCGCTDIGQQREHNEDSFCIQTQVRKLENPMGRSVQARGLYILCDGMGGHAAGEVASGMAVEAIKRYFQEHWHDDDQLPSEETLREAVCIANQAIYEVNQNNARSGSNRMGTTLAMMLIQNTNAAIAHVGDSRVYRLTRKRGLEQVTVDHEVAQREINRGVPRDIAIKRPDAYQLTQALGPRGEHLIDPGIQFLELNEDTLFVICSDGLSDHELIETHWQTHLAPLLSSRANLDQGILQLIELANEHNGHDNITAILIRVKVRPNFEQQQLL